MCPQHLDQNNPSKYHPVKDSKRQGWFLSEGEGHDIDGDDSKG